MEGFYHIPTIRAFDVSLCQGLFPPDGLSVPSHRARFVGPSAKFSFIDQVTRLKYHKKWPISFEKESKSRILLVFFLGTK